MAASHVSDRLIAAAKSGDLENVREFSQSQSSVDVADQRGRTALSEAIKHGCTRSVEILLKAKANPDQSIDGSTPLIVAAEQGNAEIVSNLLKHGAEVNRSDQQGQTPLSVARGQGHADVIVQITAANGELAPLGRSNSALKAAAEQRIGEANQLDAAFWKRGVGSLDEDSVEPLVSAEILYNLLQDDDHSGVTVRDIISALEDNGIQITDPRLQEFHKRVSQLADIRDQDQDLMDAVARRVSQTAEDGEEEEQDGLVSSNQESRAPSSSSRHGGSRRRRRRRRRSIAAPAMQCSFGDNYEGEVLSRQEFEFLVKGMDLIHNTLRRHLVIPNWLPFTEILADMYQDFKAKIPSSPGKVASYIPQLAEVDPNLFAISFCSVDGQSCSFGDSDIRFSVQSASKPVSYLISQDLLGEQTVHRFLGREPSGRNFNELCLNAENVPHNPFLNSGAIMTSSLIMPDKPQDRRYQRILQYFNSLCGRPDRFQFDNCTYLSERATADRNFCLAYMMQEAHSFTHGRHRNEAELADIVPRKWEAYSLIKHLELYFQMCSITGTTDDMSVIAATLANAGVCPLTGERIFQSMHVKNSLSLMLSCGLYEYAGEWQYSVGLPAKSGVSGILMVVVPNVGGFCLYQPKLDDLGNSQIGVSFFKQLVRVFNFHIYDRLTTRLKGRTDQHQTKIDPTRSDQEDAEVFTAKIMACSYKGDLKELKYYAMRLGRLDVQDYDRRGPLHGAASSGHLICVKYLIQQGCRCYARDRWGNTALDDARREGHPRVVKFFEEHALHCQCPPREDPEQNASVAAAEAASEIVGLKISASFEDLRSRHTSVTGDSPALPPSSGFDPRDIPMEIVKSELQSGERGYRSRPPNSHTQSLQPDIQESYNDESSSPLVLGEEQPPSSGRLEVPPSRLLTPDDDFHL